MDKLVSKPASASKKKAPAQYACISVHGARQNNLKALSLDLPLHELIGRMSDVPEGEVWVHCASGYRSSIAASLIDRPGRTVVLVDDEYESAEKLQITG